MSRHRTLPLLRIFPRPHTLGKIEADGIHQSFFCILLEQGCLTLRTYLSRHCTSHHFYSYLAIAALSRTRTTSRHPEIFLSTTDHSVLVVNTATCEITDVDCRARISAPIVDMTFAPNGRFLACFTESSMLTVISTSFETKVLDFDTSEGSASPPLGMKWCGEDRYVAAVNSFDVMFLLVPLSHTHCTCLKKPRAVWCCTGRI